MSAPASQIAAEPVVLFDTDGGVVTLTLNRPAKFNALSAEVLARLQELLDRVAADETARVVILKANGKAFCAGHDLREMRATEDRKAHQALFEHCSRMMVTLNSMPQPVIAAVQGIATAAGCQLVAACDLAVASDHASFAVSGINVGLFCSTPAVPLSRNLSRKRAMQMLLTGDFIDAATARDFGLVNEVVPAAQLDAAALALAQKIVAKSPLAIRTGKQMFYRQLPMDLSAAYQFAGTTMACNMDSEDAREGIDAFIAKRKPRWQGR